MFGLIVTIIRKIHCFFPISLQTIITVTVKLFFYFATVTMPYRVTKEYMYFIHSWCYSVIYSVHIPNIFHILVNREIVNT